MLKREAKMKTMQFDVEGMKCSGCSSKIETALSVAGSEQIQTSVSEKKVVIGLKPGQTPLDIKKVIEKSGNFKVTAMKVVAASN